MKFEPCLHLEAFWRDVGQCGAAGELVEVDHFLLEVFLVDRGGRGWGRLLWFLLLLGLLFLGARLLVLLLL